MVALFLQAGSSGQPAEAEEAKEPRARRPMRQKAMDFQSPNPETSDLWLLL
jgi:hypothetical protein